MPTSKSAFGRRWAIPLATTVPVAAVVFAFSLGPMPSKYVFDFANHAGPSVERVAIVEAGGEQAWRLLLQAAKQPTFQHREEALRFLVERRVEGVRRLLERIAASDEEAAPIRALAQSLLEERQAMRSETPESLATR